MIIVSPRAMTAIMQAYHALRECDRTAEADELLAAFREPQAVPTAPAPTPEPPKGKRVRTPEQREADRLRKAAERHQAKASNGAVRQLSDTLSNMSDSRTNGGHLADESPLARALPIKEEKRKVSEIRAVVAESEIVEKRGSSQSRACPTLSNGRTDVGQDVGQRGGHRAELKALGRLQNAIGRPFDLHSWLSELQRIAAKPEAEFAKVLTSLATDPWVKRGPSRAHPGHVIKHWGQYLEPPKPRSAVGLVPLPARHDYADDDPDWRNHGTG